MDRLSNNPDKEMLPGEKVEARVWNSVCILSIYLISFSMNKYKQKEILSDQKILILTPLTLTGLTYE